MALLQVLCLVAAALEDPDIARLSGIWACFRAALMFELEGIQNYRYCLFLQDLEIWLGLLHVAESAVPTLRGGRRRPCRHRRPVGSPEPHSGTDTEEWATDFEVLARRARRLDRRLTLQAADAATSSDSSGRATSGLPAC